MNIRRLILGVVGAVLSTLAVTATPAAASPGPWVIHGTYSTLVSCQEAGRIIVHYDPEEFMAYECALDAPRLYRLWLETRLPD